MRKMLTLFASVLIVFPLFMQKNIILELILMYDLANVSTVGFKSFDQALIAIKTRGDGYDTRIQPVWIHGSDQS